MYDAIIVGARCAGSPLAMLLARRGHRVLVLDRTALPADTVSTHYLQQYGMSRLQDWGLLDEVLATGVPEITNMTVSFGAAAIDGFAAPIDGLTSTIAPRRTVLDAVLLGAAERAGVEVRLGFTVSELVFSDGAVVGIRGRDAGGATVEERARVVVGADGAGSLVADAVGATTYNVVPAACFIYYSYWDGMDVQFHSRIGVREQFGAWPTHDGLTLVAVMRRREAFGAFRRDVDGQFRQIIRTIDPAIADQVEAGARAEPMRAMRYPDNYYRESHGPGWALVGDAGYHKDPFTGKGISDAFVHAEILAERLHETLGGARPMAEALADYQRERDAESRSAYDFTCMISELELTPQLAALVAAVSRDERATQQFFTMVGGGITGEEFFDPANVAAIMSGVAA
ncbi:NAD(P)/FAD-dependent oxidoreductase [Pseudonocardia sp. GCM10023141]|uniref:NAD(P)/FAD-dependent oxidoreductase n=1 Tax=Pseudonocardia sp. GCM10023141 TaxID=3252653 RepID=UPI003617157F